LKRIIFLFILALTIFSVSGCRKKPEQEKVILVLTESEKEFWNQVYAASVRRGQWFPERVADNAIIELRERQGGRK
jgi:hypothetical protein